ncbi:potassium-transporting ATPase subunit KdpA [Cupriavidus basilensis]
MSTQFPGLLALYLAILFAAAPFLGRYMRRAIEDGTYKLTAWGRPLERVVYKLAGVRADAEMGWKQYAVATLAFNLIGVIVVYALQRLRGYLPLNPQGFGAVSSDSAFNTAISFVANTNWQGYAGESTMSYLTQMLALTVQNFFSAATGIAVVFALIRGLARQSSATIGYVLGRHDALHAVRAGADRNGDRGGAAQPGRRHRNSDSYKEVSLVTPVEYSLAQGRCSRPAGARCPGQARHRGHKDGQADARDGPGSLAGGDQRCSAPTVAASSMRTRHIRMRIRTALANLIEMLAHLSDPGRAVLHVRRDGEGSPPGALAVLAAMTVIFAAMACMASMSELHGSERCAGGPSPDRPCGFGAAGPAATWKARKRASAWRRRLSFATTITTAASCGAVNAMHDSFTAIGGAGAAAADPAR